MSGATGLDIRLPIGALFTVLGLLLTGYGLATAGNAEQYARSLSVNLNLWWGLVLLAFGLLFLWLGTRTRGKASAHPATDTAEGSKTESREHELGLER